MHYPWWYVPFLPAPMLIAAIATLHVYVAMYAVGGGMFLAVETEYAYRSQHRDYLAYLHDHAWFFIFVTVVLWRDHRCWHLVDHWPGLAACH